MLMKKWCCMLILLCGSLQNSGYAGEEEEAVTLFMHALDKCYKEQRSDGVKMAQCVLAVVQYHASGFRFNIQLAEPNAQDVSQFTLTITNPKGYVITCTGRAHEKIEVRECKGNLTAPRSPEDELRLEPRY